MERKQAKRKTKEKGGEKGLAKTSLLRMMRAFPAPWGRYAIERA
jgi:hypothetical protein